jgi:hypothetical protein
MNSIHKLDDYGLAAVVRCILKVSSCCGKSQNSYNSSYYRSNKCVWISVKNSCSIINHRISIVNSSNSIKNWRESSNWRRNNNIISSNNTGSFFCSIVVGLYPTEDCVSRTKDDMPVVREVSGGDQGEEEVVRVVVEAKLIEHPVVASEFVNDDILSHLLEQ